MRKLLSIAILAAALPNLAMAEDKTTAQTNLEAAISACADSACKEQALQDALAGGMDLNDAIASALDAGLSNDKAANVAMAQGQDAGAITTALLGAGASSVEANTAVTNAGTALGKDANQIQSQQTLNELKDWQQYATGPKREALCEKMEQLAQTQLPPHAKNQAIKELQQNWRELGKDQHSKALWQRFKAATDEAYAPCKAEFEKEKALRLYNGQQRSEICQQLESYLEQVDFSQVNFADVDKLYRHAADEWKRFAPVERSEHKTLQDRFNQPMSQLKQALQQHKSDNIAAKQALVERAQALIELEDCQQAINEAKRLQQDWKAIGLSFQKQNQQLWGEFRQACDALFERRNQEQQTAKGEREQNLKQAQQISANILELSQAEGEELQRNQKQVQQLVQEFNNLGALPKQDYQATKSQLQASLDTFNKRVKGITVRQQQKALQALLASAEQLEHIEAATSEQQQALIASFMVPPELPDSWQDQLNQRLQQSQTPSGESNQSQFELLCIQLEIACDQDSPSAYQQQRMQYQMQQLSESFGQAKGRDLAKLVSDLVVSWCQLSSQGCEPYAELKQRFFKLALSQLEAN